MEGPVIITHTLLFASEIYTIKKLPGFLSTGPEKQYIPFLSGKDRCNRYSNVFHYRFSIDRLKSSTRSIMACWSAGASSINADLRARSALRIVLLYFRAAWNARIGAIFASMARFLAMRSRSE